MIYYRVENERVRRIEELTLVANATRLLTSSILFIMLGVDLDDTAVCRVLFSAILPVSH